MEGPGARRGPIAWVAGAAEWMKPVGGSSSDQPIGPTGIRFTLDTLETRRMVIRYTLRKISVVRATGLARMLASSFAI